MKFMLLGDIHARDDIPLCRTDDYWNAQIDKIRFIKQTAEKEKAVIIQPGDLLDKWKPSPELLTMLIEELPFMYTIAGNHDLPQHSKDLFYKSGLATLEAAGTVRVLTKPTLIEGVEVVPFSWQDPLARYAGEHTSLAVAHILTWNKIPFPGADPTGNAKSVIGQLRGFDVILTGDNHESFEARTKTQILVNPGSMMRMSAKQQDFEPCFYIWDPDTGAMRMNRFPIKNDVVSVRHIEIEKEKEDRIASFIQGVSEEIDLGLDFIANVKKALQSKAISEETKQATREVIDECNA